MNAPAPTPSSLAVPSVRHATAKALGPGYDGDVARNLLTLLAQVPAIVLAHAAERVEVAEAERDLLAEAERQAPGQLAKVFGKPRA